MSDKSKVIIAIGGTGGHVFPGCSLASHLAEKNFYVRIITDKRGYKYLKSLSILKFLFYLHILYLKKIFF